MVTVEIKYRVYSGLRVLSILVGFGGGVFLAAGFSEVVAPSLVTAGQRVPAGAAVFVAGMVAFVVFGRLRTRRWFAIGRAAGLTPTDGSSASGFDLRVGFGRSIFGGPHPNMVGEVNGRPVTVGTYTVKKSSGGEGGSSSKTYTIVDAELSAPTDVAAVLGVGEDASDLDTGEMLPGGLDAVSVDDRFVAVGNLDESQARRLLGGRAKNALLDIEDPSGLIVGDPTDAITSALPDDMGMAASFVVGKLREKLQEHPAFDDTTVSRNNLGVLLDAGEMERQMAAVAAVADAVEGLDAESGGPADPDRSRA
jgi:hypothetical protein